eukprot:SAG31_NODE_4903_length_2876_cov_3.418437_4_plen_144_part_00
MGAPIRRAAAGAAQSRQYAAGPGGRRTAARTADRAPVNLLHCLAATGAAPPAAITEGRACRSIRRALVAPDVEPSGRPAGSRSIPPRGANRTVDLASLGQPERAGHRCVPAPGGAPGARSLHQRWSWCRTNHGRCTGCSLSPS